MQTEHQSRVEEFMRKANQNLPDRPTVPDEGIRELRARLILEEALETVDALGITPTINGIEIKEEDLKLNITKDADLIGIADGCADISVVTTGTLLACGIKDKLLLENVDQNNLDKFGPGHKIREDGKIIKPPNHRPPDIHSIIEEQMKYNETN